MKGIVDRGSSCCCSAEKTFFHILIIYDIYDDKFCFESFSFRFFFDDIMRWISMTNEIPVLRHARGNVSHTEYIIVKINCMYFRAQN